LGVTTFVASCLWLGILGGSTAQAETGQAFLYAASFEIEGEPIGNLEAYHPQPGDIFLATDNLWFNKIGHWLAGSGAPHHSGIVVPTRNGGLGILEAGPKNTFGVRLTEDFVGHFAYHENKGERVWIRQRAVPLTPEECERLAEWAAAQDGKWFAAFRLVGQLTPFRSRGPWRSRYLGKP